MATITDDFNRSDDASSLGGNWGSISGFPYSHAINSNHIRPRFTSNDSGNKYTAATLDSDDHSVEADITINTSNSTNSVWLLFRAASGTTATAYFVACPRYGGTRQISKIVSGSSTVLTSESDGTPTGTRTLRGEAEGTELRLYVDDVLELSTTDGSITTGTHVGIVGYYQTADRWTLDNFVAQDLEQLNVTLLTTGFQDTDPASDFTTASISPGTDCALVLLVGGMAAFSGGGSLFPATVTSSGSGPTWTVQDSDETGSSYTPASAVYTAEIGGSDPGSFTVNFDVVGSDDTASIQWAIYRITGYDTDTPFAGAVATTDQNGDGAETLTLAATPVDGDAVLAMSYADMNNAGGATFGSGWTEDHDFASDGQSYGGGNVGHRTDLTSTSVSWTDVNVGGGGNYASAQVAIIVKAGGGTDAIALVQSTNTDYDDYGDLTLPGAPTEGNLLLLSTATEADESSAVTGAGFTIISSQNTGEGILAYKIAGSSESANIDLGLGNYDDVAWLSEWSGVDTTSPITDWDFHDDYDDVILLSVTVSDGGVHVSILQSPGDSVASDWSASGYTVIPISNGDRTDVEYKLFATGGTTTQLSDLDVFNEDWIWSVALEPAGAAVDAERTVVDDLGLTDTVTAAKNIVVTITDDLGLTDTVAPEESAPGISSVPSSVDVSDTEVTITGLGFGASQGGGFVQFESIEHTDSFDRADAGSPGGLFTDTLNSEFSIESNELRADASPSVDALAINSTALIDDQWAEIDVQLVGSSGDHDMGVTVRMSGDDCYTVYWSNLSSGRYRIRRVDGGSFNSIGDNEVTGVGNSATRRIRIQATDDLIQGFADNVMQLEATDSNYASGSSGVEGFSSGNQARGNDFACGNLVNVNAAITSWSDTEIVLDLTDLSSGDATLLASIAGSDRYITVVNDDGDLYKSDTLTLTGEEIVDDVGLTDSVVAAKNIVVTITDDLGATDTVTAAKSITVVIVDNLGLTDTVEAETESTFGIVDPVGLTDTVERAVNMARAPPDDIGLTDTVEAAVDAERTVVDDLGLTDTVTAAKNIVVVIVDDLGATDTVERVHDATRTVDDDLGLVDTATDTFVGVDTATVTDAIGLTDTVARTVDAVRAVVDDVGLTDTVVAAKSIVVEIVDDLGATDTAAAAKSTELVIVDDLGATDTVERVHDATRTVADPVGLTDTVIDTFQGEDATSVVDPVGITDTVEAAVEATRTIVDDVDLTDTVVAAKNIDVVIVDDLGAADSVDGANTGATEIVDGLGLVDTVERTHNIVREIVDDLGATDTVAAATVGADAATVTDAVGLTDSIEAAAAAVRTIVDDVGLTDTVTAAKSIDVVIVDDLGATDTVVADTEGDDVAELADPVGLTDAVVRTHHIIREIVDGIGITDIVDDGNGIIIPVPDPGLDASPISQPRHTEPGSNRRTTTPLSTEIVDP